MSSFLTFLKQVGCLAMTQDKLLEPGIGQNGLQILNRTNPLAVKMHVIPYHFGHNKLLRFTSIAFILAV